MCSADTSIVSGWRVPTHWTQNVIIQVSVDTQRKWRYREYCLLLWCHSSVFCVSATLFLESSSTKHSECSLTTETLSASGFGMSWTLFAVSTFADVSGNSGSRSNSSWIRADLDGSWNTSSLNMCSVSVGATRFQQCVLCNAHRTSTIDVTLYLYTVLHSICEYLAFNNAYCVARITQTRQIYFYATKINYLVLFSTDVLRWRQQASG